ncbi:MAG: hypothetical protein KBB39_03915 [Phycicoccus sp.]|nr:hypothetical protein [Phycicoccus sp.]
MNLDPRLRVTCGADELSEYAAGRLSPARVAAWDVHLQDCARCRYALAEEQWVRDRLAAGGPSMSGGLHSSLLALARSGPAVPVPTAEQRVPRPGTEPLPVLSPTAPPAHRSALRSTAFAAAAVGASVAAAWSLGVVASTTAVAVTSDARLAPSTSAPTSPASSGAAGTTSAVLVGSTIRWQPTAPTPNPTPCLAKPAQSSP